MSYAEVTKEMSKEEFLKSIKELNPKLDFQLISKAYDFAKKKHERQLRKSGEPYFIHLTEVAYILSELRCDTQTIVAALLHDCVEDTAVKIEDIKKEFGEDVATIVDGVTKIQRVKLSKEENIAENIRKIILATGKDYRVILVKLADRLHNIKTLKFLEPERQKEMAKETLEIYVPIAYKLGMYNIKSEMEDLCFKYLNPEPYEELKKKIGKKREEREAEVKEIVDKFKKELSENGYEVEVFGRAKNFYSIYKKMITKNKGFEEIHDLIAIRIITKTVDDCYKILGYLHSKYIPIMKEFRDYIAIPKPNGYQSLHTTLLYEKKPIEVQIRTWEMHYNAEDGIAAHWRYKGTEKDSDFDRRINWLKRILSWVQEAESAEKFFEDLKIDLFKNEIVVLTPKGDSVILPEGSTPVDFAYAVHTHLGDKCSKAIVNGKIVSLDKELESGDVVEIITSKNAKPSSSWLKFVKTKTASQKIRKALGIPKEDKSIKANAELSEQQLLKLLDLKGIKPSLVKFGKCCNPQYGDEIIAIKTKDGKYTIHKKNCINQFSSPREQTILLEWKSEDKGEEYTLNVSFIDRVGLLSDILKAISSRKINVTSVKSKTTKRGALLTFQLNCDDSKKIEELKEELKKINNILGFEFKKEKLRDILRNIINSRFRKKGSNSNGENEQESNEK
ncbi:MAG: RelA/SpoT family protein [Candidatus Woesearchaeota archaeon]